MGDKMFHVSSKDLGKKFVFVPRIPQSAEREKECIITERICVAPTVLNCLLAINGTTELCRQPVALKYPPLVVYEFQCDEYYTPSKEECFDVDSYGEKWILHNEIGYRVGYIKTHDLVFKGEINIVKSIHKPKA